MHGKIVISTLRDNLRGRSANVRRRPALASTPRVGIGTSVPPLTRPA